MARQVGLPPRRLGRDVGLLADPLADRVVYLESVGFGTNNSGDPLYIDSVSYDVVLLAQSAPAVDGDFDGDGDVDLRDASHFGRCRFIYPRSLAVVKHHGDVGNL